MLELLAAASLAIGRLDGVTALAPNPALFIYSYVRKEAVLSSQIEGTESSLSDLLLFESDAAPGVPLDDVREVSNYAAALTHGLARLEEGFPLSLRLLREIHSILLTDCRGSDKTPGEFRRSQNWVGGTKPSHATYVPPPVHELMPALDNLERFLHDEYGSTPLLLKAGIAHAQFETIHPFLDGNGRVGRLLVTLLLCAEGVLTRPLLYLSLYLRQNRTEYYAALQRVRTDGDWEGWIQFFLTGVREVAEQATGAIRQLQELFDRDRQRIRERFPGAKGSSALRVFEVLTEKPMLSANGAIEGTGLTRPTVLSAFRQLESQRVVEEVTGRQRNRHYVYKAYLATLSEEDGRS